jgi:prefoldin subunit 5
MQLKDNNEYEFFDKKQFIKENRKNMKSAIYNLTIRKTQMEASLEQLDKDVSRNNKIIEILNRASDEEKKDLELDKFTKTIQEQIDSCSEQRVKLVNMIDRNNKVLDALKDDKSSEIILNDLLVSFGFEEAETKDTSNS